MSTLNDEILSLREALCVKSDAQLAKMLGYSPANVSVWRKRGSVPAAAKQRAKSLERGVIQARARQERREALGHQVMYEGLCLALFLAPSFDAMVNRRIAATFYSGTLRDFASYFSEIELSCAEAVADRMASAGCQAAMAFASLTRDDPAQLLEQIMDRARWWREGDLSALDNETAPTLHEARSEYRPG